MMAYQLSTGKTIYISFEEWLDMTDEKEQEYVANNVGYTVNNPFFMSSISSPKDEEIVEPIIIEEIEDIEGVEPE